MTRKRILILAATLAAVAVALGFFWPFRHRTQTLNLPGVVEIQEIRLGSKVGGRVAEVAITEGDVVEANQLLVRFDVPELKAQHEQAEARLRQAEADWEKAKNGPRQEEKDEAQAAVEAAKARWERLKAGPRPEEIRQARSDLDTAEADLKLAREELERTERIFRKAASSRAEYDTARANQERTLGRTLNAKAKLDLLLAGSRQEDIDEAAAAMRQADAHYRLLRAGTRSEDIDEAYARVVEARGKVRELKANLDEADVRAPGRAIIEVLAVRKGDLVPPNQPVVRILRAEDLWVKVYVPETELGKLGLNQPVEVTVDAYPGERLAGTVMQIASESEFTPRNVQSVDERRHQVFGVKVRVPNPKGIFKAGMAADVWLPLQD